MDSQQRVKCPTQRVLKPSWEIVFLEVFMLKFMLIVFIVVASFLYFYARLKTENPVAQLKKNGALKGIIFAFVFFTVGAALFYAVDANSSERVKYLHYSTIYAGLEQQLGGSVFCHNDGISDKLTSNLGRQQGQIKNKGTSSQRQNDQ